MSNLPPITYPVIDRRGVRQLFVTLMLLALSLGIAACGDDDDKATPIPSASPAPTQMTSTARPTEIPPTATVSPTPAIPGYARDKRTGNPQVDAVLDAILSGDAAKIKPLLRFFAVGCQTESHGIGGPPICAPGVAAGTSIEVFPNASCPEGRLSPREGIDALLSALFDSSSRVFAVYRQTPKLPTGNEWPKGAFGIVFTTARPYGAQNYTVSRIEVDGGQIVLAGVLCPGDTPQMVLANSQARDFLVPPPP